MSMMREWSTFLDPSPPLEKFLCGLLLHTYNSHIVTKAFKMKIPSDKMNPTDSKRLQKTTKGKYRERIVDKETFESRIAQEKGKYGIRSQSDELVKISLRML
ncbi:hypothetical protein TNCV_728561 [Trichonephila clavipes]|nr:hypothetical protein TNCV_728561 [Trichonephila clavipes]